MTAYYKSHEVTKEGLWKFVKVNGEYRFVPNESSHKACLSDGEVPTSAGTFGFIGDDAFRIYDTGSFSLGIGMDAEGEDNLAEMFNRNLFDPWAE